MPNRNASACALLKLLLLSITAWPLGATCCCAAPESEAESEQHSELAKALTPLIQSHRGKVAVAIKRLDDDGGSSESFTYNAEEPMPTASLIKLPLMAAAYEAVEEGNLSLDDKVTLEEDDKVPGSGILTSHFSAGVAMPLRDAIELMIVYSDNTATNLVVDQVGMKATAELMESLGCPETKLHSKVFRRDTSAFPERSKKYGLGSTTAADMVKLLGMIDAGELVSADASRKMREHLLACDDRQKFPRHLPAGVTIWHKTGSVNDTRTDAGVLETPGGKIAVCVLTTENEDKSWSDSNEGDLLCAEVARIVFAHFNPSGAPLEPTVARVLKLGADGPLVESLQRTLNTRLSPSPDLGVDGDFGPATESAVLRFQSEQGLPENGEVGPDFWRKLGPLVTEDAPSPAPEVVNSEIHEKEAPEPLHGLPFVTAKAWCITDADTGEVLWNHDGDVRRDPASTTKIMTALLVCDLAAEDPAVLEETVTFSKRADETPGSTTGLNAGEQVSVGDLLYGLLLPSGNDGSVALAEHFGERLAVEGGPTAPYESFVAAMNRKAAEIGMERSHFENTHGLSAKGHQLTAHDLAILGRAAMQHEEFRKRVATRKYGCTVQSLAGYERNVVWRNTNHLLAIEGYDGVKTGTTGAAGACLVSRGHRGGRTLMMVVLGATSGDARYADSQNLYRWAWLELGLDDDSDEVGGE